MEAPQCILILDFGGQYTQLIARRVRERGVYSCVLPCSAQLADIRAVQPMGIIFSGGPASVLDEGAPQVDEGVFDLGVPVLGICYGMQLMAHLLDAPVERGTRREYGRTDVTMDRVDGGLLAGLRPQSPCWMSHTYQVTRPPEGFVAIAHTADCPVAAMADDAHRLYGVQFHPEVTHTEEGARVLENFLFGICGCKGDWSMDAYADMAVEQIREQVGDGTVLLGLSGGVDSAVAAALLYRAIGNRLTCVYVDHGFMRAGESDQVVDVFTRVFPVELVHVDASERFFRDLKGVTDPEAKRKIIGRDFVEVFCEEAQKLGKRDHFAQGTIYPDVIESGQAQGSAVIKSHHNVGGLPAELGFESLVEPLRMLFKDEVRRLGLTLGLPESLVYRQPFPGPGLGVRCIGAITRDRLEAVRESDAILREEFAKNGLEGKVWQYFTVVPDIKSTGIIDGKRSFDWPVIIRAVNTVDAVTAEVAQLDFGMMQHIVDRITHEVSGVNRVLWDLTPKPTGTIEWE